ncbi:hypothetical protein UWK_01099 [Desulfocapsa sulfexigens DSM 10523]|uniref:Thiamine-binding protein domain-containing protein n=2 Tax=Desulfocapsa TaxID=53318 RepID=M1ND32_DESSD|nr:hypothetical protein UWK_01099 [Desulfocapsa sulfexigens DSM 10523]
MSGRFTLESVAGIVWNMQNATFKLNDMGTLIEGKITDLFAILEKIYEIPFDQGAVRVVTHITIDDRRDKDIKIGDKTASVTARINDFNDEKTVFT